MNIMGEVHKDKRLDGVVKTIERFIIKTLIAFMSLLLILATLQLGYLIIINILQSDVFLLDMDVLMDLFGVFLLVLIGIELLDTIKVYFKKHDIHVEVVILVAIIAIARKVILLDMDHYSGLEIIGIAAVIVALTLGYYLIKKAGGAGFWPAEQEVSRDIVIEEKEFDPENQTKVAERKKVVKQHTSESKKQPDESSIYTGPKDLDIEKEKNQKPDKEDDIND